jgi:hypothetical protein
MVLKVFIGVVMSNLTIISYIFLFVAIILAINSVFKSFSNKKEIKSNIDSLINELKELERMKKEE